MEKPSHTNGARASAVTGNSSPNKIHSRADRTRRTTGREGGERRRGEGGGIGRRPQMEGVLSKYTNLLQGWQNRYFVLDEELHQLQYFVNEQGRSQKPRGILSLIGAVVTTSDEAPHMFVVNSTNGELFKLRAVDSREQQLWMSHIQSCTTDSSVRTLKDSEEQLCVDRTVSGLDPQASTRRSFSLLPSASSSTSSSPRLQRHLLIFLIFLIHTDLLQLHTVPNTHTLNLTHFWRSGGDLPG
ncbi:oxysterol-binding protein-related protein 10 isoform X2 [Silurus meridionalis]|uniref:oxysterol-binding protein-related protein 10 isoform X2 n=1 Tax=Silurus meridionalis TaxID=175797 RepID=UPI001EEADA9C|nr:oxysterol-binding protein-related protein 10 isoform X2 [Silurus meridionalis]